jgi:glycine oxidase
VKVAIIGGGVIGCAVAYELASRGASVRIIDPRGPGLGATRASAGILAPYIEGHSEALLTFTVYGLAAYDDFIARLRSDSARPLEYRRSGTLQVARDDAEAATLRNAAGHLSSAGVAHTILDAEGVRRVEPSLVETLAAGLLVPEHGYISAPALMSALGDALERRGAITSRGTVTRIDPAAAGLRVVTLDGSFDADAVVVAAGSWSGRLAAPPAPVRPIRGQLLQVRFPEPPISRVIWGSGCYLVPWHDGTLLIGATVEDVGFDERPTAGGIRHLLASAAQLLPSIESAAFEEVRVGLRPLVSDELPLIGPSSTMRGVYYATGHYRNGVLLAPLTALLLAELVLDGRERPELALVTPRRLGL